MAYFQFVMDPTVLPVDPLPTWEVQNPVSTVFVMDKIPPTAGSLAAGNSTVPDEYLVDPAIDTLLLLMEAKNIYFHKTVSNPFGIVGSNAFVVIKGNFQWTSRNTTSTDRIKGIIWQILQHPDGFTGEILVCDNTQNSGTGINHDDNNSEDVNQSIVDVVNTFYSKGYPVYLLDWNTMWNIVVTEYSAGNYNNGFIYESASKISYPKFTSPSGNYKISLRYGIWDSIANTYNIDRLCIINVPVLKAHSLAGSTIGVKNWTGVLTTAYQNERYGGFGPMHDTYFFGQYALIAKVMSVTFPKLTIVDAEWTSGSGPYYLEDTVHTKMLLGSTDPCAVSWYAAKYILTPVAVDPNNTDPDLPGSNYKNNLDSWTNCLKDSGFACTKDPSEISVYSRNSIMLPCQSLSVSNGWNMISMPFLSDNMTSSNLFPTATSSAYGFDGGYIIVDTLVIGKGYWLKFNENQQVQICGSATGENTVPVKAGWNMFGVYEEDIPSSQITSTPQGIIATYCFGFNNSYYIADTLESGRGYWVKVTQDGVLNLNSGELSREGMKDQLATIDENWGRIKITDNEGKSITLYGAEENISSNFYDLPPMPPMGIFDVRFSSGKLVEDLSSEKTILINSDEYPITIRAEGINLTIGYRINGKVLNNELKSGEELRITDYKITSIAVIGKIKEGLPLSYELYQNYPNPFNPTTIIKFAIPKESNVNLSIYNILGELTSTLVNEQLKAGYYEYEFNAANFTSGVYLYRIKAGDFIDTKKIVLIK